LIDIESSTQVYTETVAADGSYTTTRGVTPICRETWEPQGQPRRVDVHDFPDPEIPKAVPYGVSDLAANEGFVSVGESGDTAAFAVETIRRWWDLVGMHASPDANRLFITADAGGSNGYRTRLWKVELAKLAKDAGIEITVCHFPPGTSKWIKVEHRLWSHVSMNWPTPVCVASRGSYDKMRKHSGPRLTREGCLDRGSDQGIREMTSELFHWRCAGICPGALPS